MKKDIQLKVEVVNPPSKKKQKEKAKEIEEAIKLLYKTQKEAI